MFGLQKGWIRAMIQKDEAGNQKTKWRGKEREAGNPVMRLDTDYMRGNESPESGGPAMNHEFRN